MKILKLNQVVAESGNTTNKVKSAAHINNSTTHELPTVLLKFN